jgi:multicomponent Na+:H+ antiporter subunit A
MIPVLLIVFFLAATAPALQRVFRSATGWALALPVIGFVFYFASLLPTISGGEVVLETRPWAPELGINLSFRVDGWSLLFLLLISGIGVLILIYAGGYLQGHPQQGRFFGFLLFFMGSMLGLVASDDLILMFVFWELTSFSSYLLIGFDHERKEARSAALQALLVTGGGGLALLTGFILIGQAAGVSSCTALLEGGDILRGHEHYLAILILLLVAAFTKSAQTPFHFWLPGAMLAPTPVSAYLHSATMVKAGVFLLGRFHPLLGGTDVWYGLVAGVGLLTMITGGLLALPQTDLKRLLAYSTVSALGVLTFLMGVGTALAIKAAVVFLLIHSLYKGALFMVAGAIDHETGTRDVRLLGGLAKGMPITALAAACAVLSMSGFPPFLGFIGKELLYEAQLEAPQASMLFVIGGVLTNVAMIAVAIVVGYRPFYGSPQIPGRGTHEPSVALWIGPLLLGACGLLAGLFPYIFDSQIMAPAASAILGSEVLVDLKLWHGFNKVLLMSFLTVILGFLLYLFIGKIRAAAASRFSIVSNLGPESIYRGCLNLLTFISEFQTRLLQHGYLRGYVFVVLCVAMALAGFALSKFSMPLSFDFREAHLDEVAIGVIILIAALFVAVTASRLAAVAAVGVVGYCVALLYALYGAPDLALTQILVETLTLVLFVLVVLKLPHFSKLSSPRRKSIDAILSACAGLVITLLVLKALYVEPASRVSGYYVEHAGQAQGKNIVNVILVDFRALDTLGEITVLSVAALGVFALTRLRLQKKEGS